MSDLRNNLFYYATKELSQDAFICWLCSYALEDCQDPDQILKECALELVSIFLKKEDEELKNIDVSQLQIRSVEKQVNNIDVLLTVIYKGDTYRIIIEDKIHTSEHSNQLSRYKESLSKHEENCDVIGIYFKTGFQSDYSAVNKAGYKVFGRNHLLEILKKYVNITSNDIFINYYDYWDNFDNVVKSYKTNLCDNWDWRQVYGFFEEMQETLQNMGCWVGYDYVANPSGGFHGLWFGVDDDHIEIDTFKAALYLQVEAKWNSEKDCYNICICLKLENLSEELQDDRIWKLRGIIIENQPTFGFEKPRRLGSGLHMTVGLYSASFSNSDELKSTILSAFKNYNELIRCADNIMRA